MNFYSKFIFPRLLDFTMSGSQLAPYRQETLSPVEGKVLEIGFGTGLNLSYYPENIEKLVTVDPNPGANKLAQKRIKKADIEVDSRVLNGENLPMEANTFDTVVSTWTLCSIPKVEQAIAEIHRVLKPGGKFVFIEHGLSDEPSVQKWQNHLTPIQKIVGDGCHLNRNIRELVKQQFDNLEIKEFYVEDFPKVIGYHYQGIAIK